MALDIKDRVPTRPGRIKLTAEDGTSQYYTMERADEPTQEGTPINKALLDNMQKAENVSVSSDVQTIFGKDNVDECLGNINSMFNGSLSMELIKSQTLNFTHTGTSITTRTTITSNFSTLKNYIAIVCKYTGEVYNSNGNIVYMYLATKPNTIGDVLPMFYVSNCSTTNIDMPAYMLVYHPYAYAYSTYKSSITNGEVTVNVAADSGLYITTYGTATNASLYVNGKLEIYGIKMK